MLPVCTFIVFRHFSSSKESRTTLHVNVVRQFYRNIENILNKNRNIEKLNLNLNSLHALILCEVGSAEHSHREKNKMSVNEASR